MDTVDLEDLGLELLLIAALHDEAERLASQLPEHTRDPNQWKRTSRSR
ncbi:hypothetical protein [Sphaerisporangium fuscum]|nr:hypothetical protein [Sphaerisporangium fuscum]